MNGKSKKSEALARYRAVLDKHHYCPFCDYNWDSNIPDNQAVCLKCSATAWERLCRIESDGKKASSQVPEELPIPD